MRRSIPWLLVTAMLLVACGSGSGGGGADADDADAHDPPTGPCPEQPLRQDALAGVQAQIDAALATSGETEVEPAPAQDRYHFATTSFFAYDQVVARVEVARLYATAEAFAADPGVANFSTLPQDVTVDWSTESILVLLAWPEQFTYRYGVTGDHLTIYTGHLLPCDAYATADLRVRFDGEPLLLRVPKVTTVSIVPFDATYRFVEAQASDRCERDPEQPVLVRKGGHPFVRLEPASAGADHRYHMWYGGFSAATGVLIETFSPDGVTWTPKGWDEAHLGTFDAHSPYTDHYRPCVVDAPGGGLWIFYLDANFQMAERRLIARAAGVDGVSWTDEVAVLEVGEAGAWDAYRVSSPYVVTVDGGFRLYYTGLDRPYGTWAIGLATSPDGVTWTRHPGNPILVPGAPGRFDDLGVGGPAVLHDGTGYLMLYNASTGGGDGSIPQTASIGLARSDDGLTWTREDRPILVPANDWDKVGVATPGVVLEDDALTVWFTGINDRFEPSIGRARCAY